MNFRTRLGSPIGSLREAGPRRWLAVGVATAVALACGIAAAQVDAPPATSAAQAPAVEEPLGEIVITAQKRSEKLQEVPASVSVVTSQEIELSNAVTIEGLLNQVPGVTFHKGDIPFNTSLFLRGVGTINFALGAEPSVGYVVDGVVMGTAGQAFGDLLDVERIEVIPGPQGTLFGKNSSAGVVSVVSRMPKNLFSADFDVEGYQGGETRARASFDVPITDRLLTRTTLFTGKYDGNLTNLYQPAPGAGTSKINGYDHQGVRSIWKFLATDDLTFTFIGDWRQSKDNCCTFVTGTPPGTPPGANAAAIAGNNALLAGTNFAGDETRQVAQSLVTQSIERERGFSLQADWDINRYTITNILSYRYWAFNEIRDGDFIPVTAAYVGTGFEQLHDVGPQTVSTFTEELRLASPTGGTFEYVAGLYYFHTVQNRYFERDDIVCTASTLAPIVPGLTPCAPGASTYTTPKASANFGADIANGAAFGQGTIRIAAPLRVIVGLRGTHDELSFSHLYTLSPVTGGGVIAGNCSPQPRCLPFEGTGSTTHSNVSGKAGLEWDIRQGYMTYVTYSRGYKGPAYNVYFNQNNAQAAPLAPETSTAWEAGLKSTILDGNGYLNLAVFHEAFDNFQANSPTTLNGVVITQLTNAGSAATQGVELTGAAKITPAWGVNGGFTYADAHVTDFNAPAGGNPFATAPPGSPLPFAPKYKGNIATDYRWTGALPVNVVVSTNYEYTGEQYSDFATCTTAYCPHGGDNPYLRLHGYGLWNASIGVSDRDDRLTLTALVKNLLGRSYASFSQTGGPGGTIQYFIPRDADRYFGVQLRYKFTQ